MSFAQRATPFRFIIAVCAIFVFATLYYGWNTNDDQGESLLEKYKLCPDSPVSPAAAARRFKNFFVFGDSYTAQPWEERTNEFLISNFKVDGVWKRKPFWSNFLAEEYLGEDAVTVNFAEGGSTTNNSIIKPGFMGNSFVQQSEIMFKNYFGAERMLEWNPDTTVFITAYGVNDMIGAFEKYDGMAAPPQLPLAGIVSTYQTIFEKIYDHGGRHFLILAVAPIHLALPPFGTEITLERRRVAFGIGIAAYNARLYNMALVFRRSHPDATIHVFDQPRLFSSAIDDPQQYPQTVNIRHTTELCRDAVGDDQVGRLDWDFKVNVCQSGELSQAHIWHPIHASYPMHNLTAAKITEDCYGPESPTGFCW